MGRAAALLYTAVSVGVVIFQIMLAAGAPWGAYAMGGAFPGQFPLALRIAALAQAALIAGMAIVVLSRAGLVLAGWSEVTRWLVWCVVALAAVSLVLNLMTPSAGYEFPPKQTALVLGETIEYVTAGIGPSIVVLVNGSGGPIEGWHKGVGVQLFTACRRPRRYRWSGPWHPCRP